jgi:amino acid permease
MTGVALWLWEPLVFTVWSTHVPTHLSETFNVFSSKYYTKNVYTFSSYKILTLFGNYVWYLAGYLLVVTKILVPPRYFYYLYPQLWL